MEQHPPILIDTLEKLDEALNYWKNTTFSQHYLKLGDVVDSLRKSKCGGAHLVDARQEYTARWVFSAPGGKRPVTIWTVAVWRWSSDLDTGNFVPPRETAPARLPESRIQTIPNNMCQFTYVLDTTHDKLLWDAQTVFEEYVKKTNKFNPGKKGRREFQNGLGNTHTFHLSSQMFVKRTTYTRTKEACCTYPLHDWIKNATKKGMPFFANDEKPVLFEPDEEGGLRPLSEGYPPMLKVGDLVWMSFSVEFFIGTTSWATNFIPYEFIHVGSVALELLPHIKKDFDEDVEEEGPRERLGIGMRSISAADAHLLNAVVDLPAVPPVEQPAGIATEPNTDLAATNATAIASTYVPGDPGSFRNLLPDSLARPRSPRAFIDSESEERTTTDEDEVSSVTQPDDDENTTQDYLSMDDFIVDDDSSLTDIAASPMDNAASFMGDTASPACDDASLPDDSASVEADAASVHALVRSPDANSKPMKQLDKARRPEAAQPADDTPKLKGKKRPVTSEMVLRSTKRPANGKGVAK